MTAGSPERAKQQRQNNRELTSVLRPFRAALDLFSSPSAIEVEARSDLVFHGASLSAWGDDMGELLFL
jgi:hypothetical protein